MGSEVLFNLNGNIATMQVYEDRAVISGKKNPLAFMTGRALDGSKEFYFSDLTSVQYKEATKWINGFIQFEYPGSHSGDNFVSENSFVIMAGISDVDQCRKAYEYIRERVSYYKNNKNSGGVSQADELKKFKELYDMGVISQDEFEEKKKKILGI